MSSFQKGDWTNCRYDICEIVKDDDVFCTVAAGDVDLVISVLEENECLKETNQELFDDLQNKTSWLSLRGGELAILKRENEQLKQRNDRQAKQLDRLYNLIEEKDWRTLNDILDDFKRCEEQLQQEWKCYE